MSNDRVVLNVGGTKFEVMISTLLKFPNSRLGKMFCNPDEKPPVDNNGEIFFDRNGRYFEIVIDYYRTESLNLPPDITPAQMKKEFAFWELEYPNEMKNDDDLDISEEEFNELSEEEKFKYAKRMIHFKDSDILIKGISFMTSIYENMDEKHPLVTEALYFISLGYYRMGNISKARFYAEKALSIDPEHHSKSILVLSNDTSVSYAKLGLLVLGIAGIVSLKFLFSFNSKKKKK